MRSQGWEQTDELTMLFQYIVYTAYDRNKESKPINFRYVWRKGYNSDYIRYTVSTECMYRKEEKRG